MSSVNAGDHKDRFNELRDDQTQEEFMGELLDAYEIVDGSGIDMEEVLERIEVSVASKAELASYRGSKQAVEDHHDNND
jgi:hypothetical protein